ncbi:MAG: 1-acyl-sn-glycerol-3-phosphate acyltransferase, partial [Syntrophothermus sp.]
ITWNNIILIALLMVVIGLLLYLVPLPRRRKEYCFHYLFSKLSKLYIAITFPTNRKLINPEGEDFKKPSIIISNHQSLIETPAFLRLHPKILILTNDWVWNSPLFGPIARMASFFNADHGLDLIMDKLQEKVNDGYSVLIFPEAHRSGDGNIQRFHRGAFYLAEKLNLDILPVVVFGSGDFLGKNAIWGRPNPLIMKILPRISVENTLYGQTLSEKTRCVRKMYRLEYEKLKNAEATPHYYRKKLILNYVLKGPVLEWYLRVKMKLANNYEVFDQLIPKEGKIIDLGCGYGYISCMLMMTSDKRIITGVDYDEEKIRVAQNGFLINDRLSFVCDDIAEFPISTSSGFLLSDVLHYLTKEKQEALLHKCIENLDTGGIIVIRDADSANQLKHKSSKLTEFLSTRVIKFNKTAPENKTLTFTSAREIEEIAGEYGLGVEIIQESIHTSNILMVIRK